MHVSVLSVILRREIQERHSVIIMKLLTCKCEMEWTGISRTKGCLELDESFIGIWDTDME